MKQKIRDILQSHMLFRECSDSLFDQLISDAQLRNYATEQTLKDYNEEPFLAIIIEGEATVHTQDIHNDLLLRILRSGDTFGVAHLFGQSTMMSRVTAQKPTVALCISADTMRHALTVDNALAVRYIEFLSDRIRFLNQRIATLTAGTAERRLAAWLDAVIPETTNQMILPLPMNRLADTLAVGRASLYRAFDELTLAGYIKRTNKTITLIDRAAMRQENGLV